MNAVAIQLEQVSKFYKLYDSPKDRFKEALDPFRRRRHRDFFALQNISLTIRKGEILGVVGRNGSGKSTLLKLLTGVIPLSSGSLTVNGRISALLELGSGMNPDLNGIQNIYFGGIMMGIPPKEMTSRMDEIIAFADIGDFIHQPLKTYSSGMKARLGFALAVSMNPEILVIDEVLSVGDDLFRRKCHARMEEFFKGGRTILFVSHDANSINGLCSRAILLDKGECLLDGPPKMVTMYYHKMIYSRPEHQKAILEEIRRLDANPARKENFDETAGESLQAEIDKEINDALPGEMTINETAGNSVLKPYYLPQLISKSVVECRNYEADISDIEIVTEDGTRVNVLVHGQRYYLQYKVNFNVTLNTLQFSNAIKTETGQSIAGYTYPDKDSYIEKQIVKGTVITYKMLFDCLLIGGKNYYLNIGLRTLAGAESTVVNRIVDAYLFRVISDNHNNGGLVSLNQKVVIS